jgi:putative membrane protein
MTNRTYRTLQAFILAGLGGFLLERFWSGKLIIYIHQRFIWLILLSAFALIGLAINSFNHRPPVWTEDNELLTQSLAHQHAKLELLILIIPLILGILIPAQSLDANAAQSRSVNLTAPLLVEDTNNPLQFSQISEERSILDWLWAFEKSEQPDELIGQNVDVEGFIFTNKAGSSEESLMVGRFIITCCVADAIPVGIAVIPPEGDEIPDGWVRIRGIMNINSLSDQEHLVIKALKILDIEAPNNPYLYP